jgi:hypothetical protein
MHFSCVPLQAAHTTLIYEHVDIELSDLHM